MGIEFRSGAAFHSRKIVSNSPLPQFRVHDSPNNKWLLRDFFSSPFGIHPYVRLPSGPPFFSPFVAAYMPHSPFFQCFARFCGCILKPNNLFLPAFGRGQCLPTLFPFFRIRLSFTFHPPPPPSVKGSSVPRTSSDSHLHRTLTVSPRFKRPSLARLFFPALLATLSPQ